MGHTDKLPLHICQMNAEEVKRKFEGTYERWEFAGELRRQKPGPAIIHVVIPRIAECNLVWKRLSDLARMAEVQKCADELDLVDEDAQTVGFDVRQHHQIYLATRNNWGMKLAQWTGPMLYWQMLWNRLHDEGTLQVHKGHVCNVVRTQAADRLEPLEVFTEEEFFKLARTKYLEPKSRKGWQYPHLYQKGMQRPYLPDFVKGYVDPAKRPDLFVRNNRLDRPVRRARRSK